MKPDDFKPRQLVMVVKGQERPVEMTMFGPSGGSEDRSYQGLVLRIEGVNLPYLAVSCLWSADKSHVGMTFLIDSRKYAFVPVNPTFARAIRRMARKVTAASAGPTEGCRTPPGWIPIPDVSNNNDDDDSDDDN